MTRLTLRFENMPERHAELAWRFGEPDALLEGAPGPGGQGSASWVIASPLPPESTVPEHLAWASELIGPQEAFVRELISLGGKVVLSLRCEGRAPEFSWQANARLLLPMAHAGMLLEFGFGQKD